MDSAVRWRCGAPGPICGPPQQRIEVAKAAVAEAEESLRITQNRYEAGMSNVTDLLRTETAVLEAGPAIWRRCTTSASPPPCWNWPRARSTRFGGLELMTKSYSVADSVGASGWPAAATRRATVEPAAPAAPFRYKSRRLRDQQWPSLYEATGTVRARTSAVSSKADGVRARGRRPGRRPRARGPAAGRRWMRRIWMPVPPRGGRPKKSQRHPGSRQRRGGGARPIWIWRRSRSSACRSWLQKKSISNQEFDEASARLKSAQAAYDMARAKRSQLDSRLAQVRAGDPRRRGHARLRRTFAAPFAGVVTARSVEPGNLAVPGAPLLTIEREGAYRLEASVDESRLPAIPSASR